MHYIQTAEDIVKLSLSPVAPIILVLTPSANAQFQGESLKRRRKLHGGGENLRFSTEIAVVL